MNTPGRVLTAHLNSLCRKATRKHVISQSQKLFIPSFSSCKVLTDCKRGFSVLPQKKTLMKNHNKDGLTTTTTNLQSLNLNIGQVICHRNFYCSERKDQQRTCWRCNTSLLQQGATRNVDFVDKFHCPETQCGVLQPPCNNMNYFEQLGLAIDYDLDTKSLTRRYRIIQSRLHPDKAAQLSKQEQEYADQQSTAVNKAYDALLKPVPRALYLLKLNGLSLEEKDIQLDGEFLMDIMEINEEIAATEKDDELKIIFDNNRAQIECLIKQMSLAFRDKDFQLAKTFIAKIKYFVNIEDKIKEKTYFH